MKLKLKTIAWLYVYSAAASATSAILSYPEHKFFTFSNALLGIIFALLAVVFFKDARKRKK